MAKILKNTTASPVTLADVGQTIPASGQITIDPSDYDKYAGSADVIVKIDDGTLILNDGIQDLSETASLAFIKHPDLAENIRYKTSVSTTTDLQSIISLGSVQGNEFRYTEDLTETSTNSATVYATKLTLTANNLPEGDYILMWRARWRAANTDRGIDFQTNRDSTELGLCRFFTSSNAERSCETMFFYLNNQSAGSYSYTLKFKVGIGSTTVYTNDAQMVLWRVG